MSKKTIEGVLFGIGWPLLLIGVYGAAGLFGVMAGAGFVCLFVSFEIFKDRKRDEAST